MLSTRKLWDRTARWYTTLRQIGPFGWLRRVELREAKRLLEACQDGGVWIDLGCGEGTVLGLVDWSGLRVGLDWSQGMICQAGAERTKLVVADARALPLRTGSVQRVTAVGLEEYVPEKEVLWAEMARVLTKDGHALVTLATPVPLNLVRVVLGKGIYLTDLPGAKKLWEREGLRVVKVENTLLQRIVLLRKA